MCVRTFRSHVQQGWNPGSPSSMQHGASWCLCCAAPSETCPLPFFVPREAGLFQWGQVSGGHGKEVRSGHGFLHRLLWSLSQLRQPHLLWSGVSVRGYSFSDLSYAPLSLEAGNGRLFFLVAMGLSPLL